jgi:recombination associated protein RdgC
MKIISNAIVFKAELPRLDLLAQHLEQMPFKPVCETMVSSAGFVPNPVTGELVTPIEGGYSFTMRRDEKLLPKSAVRAAVNAEIQALLEETGEELTKEEAAAVSEAKIAELIRNAMVQTKTVNAFYSTEKQYLFIPTTNKKLAQTMVGLVIQAVGSVKTETIHVADVKGGLTKRLKDHIAGAKTAFDGFTLGNSCLLKEKSDRVSFDLCNLDTATNGVRESLEAGMQVERLELGHGDLSFKLTKDFHLRGIDFFGELTEAEEQEREDFDMPMLWRTEAAIQLLQLCAVLDGLCELLGYKEGDGLKIDAPSAPAQPEAAETETEEDPLYSDAVGWVRASKRASVSTVQRKFLIGYNRAARMIERMEVEGVVTSINSHGEREVIQ